MNTRYQPLTVRLAHGKEREAQIANALQIQAGLNLIQATQDEDKERKIDRWWVKNNKKHALQIKYRENSDQVLFEIFNRFEGFDHPANKIGRDMRGTAEFYACLLGDRKTVVIFPTILAKNIIQDSLTVIKSHGWVIPGVFRWFINNYKMEIRLQTDPNSGLQKMLAYFPKNLLESLEKVEKYTIRLPDEWKKAA